MSKIELDVLFKKMQKDDKKEVLEFHILGDEIPYKSELISMAGAIAIINIEDIKLSAEFKSIQRDSKKVVLKFEAKGDSEDEIIKLYPKAGFNVKLFLKPSQMSIDEFYEGEQDPGLEYNVNNDGTVEVSQGQMDMNDIPVGEDEPESETEDEDDLLN
ncbi:hypothetical protein [Pseudogracilibacillus auburnensis]|uniref:hypothetical protein n=1 Tax=Pseudogracilibacillus auburnensis TaxID=1494959 RepID=UPI001F60D75A|nr:hypothetical protein [Pseudogracilibacillus auburnensis]